MRFRNIILTVAALGAGTLLGGCDRDVAHEKEVKVKDGEIETRETTVTESPGGNITVKETTTEVEDGKTKTETKTEEYKAPQP